MDVTAAFLAAFVGTVDANHWCCGDMGAFEVHFVAVEGEGCIEGRFVERRQLKDVVIMGEGVDTHL